MLALALLLAQAPPAGRLVGDTVWIDREVRAPAGSLLRPLPWDPGRGISLLGPPVVEVRSDGWVLRYPLAFWEAGIHRLQVPGPLVIRQDGRTDSLPSQTVEVEIASLLPRARPDTVAPRPAAELLPLGEQSAQPLAVLVLLVGALLVPLHWWWRRRGRPVPPTPAPRRGLLPTQKDLDDWGRLGEWRLVADTWIARREGESPDPEADALLRALRAARFGTGDPATLERLCREAASP